MNLMERKQLDLFNRVKKRWPLWSNKRASGYVHGVKDGLIDEAVPFPLYIQECIDQQIARNEVDCYACGYVFGFVDACGLDVMTSQWRGDLNISDSIFDFRWWDKCDDINSDK